MIQFTINDIKNDIIQLFKDERVWQAITEFSDDSSAGDRFVKSKFLVEEFSYFFNILNTDQFLDILEKYESQNLSQSITKFKKTMVNVLKKTSLDKEAKLKMFQTDLLIAQEITLNWFKKKWKSDKELTIEYINTNPDSKKVFEEQCFNLWEKKLNSLILENQKSNYYEFEQNIFTNRHLSLKS